jgi:hypothetical protein
MVIPSSESKVRSLFTANATRAKTTLSLRSLRKMVTGQEISPKLGNFIPNLPVENITFALSFLTQIKFNRTCVFRML